LPFFLAWYIARSALRSSFAGVTPGSAKATPMLAATESSSPPIQ
jgi:hypothetical protein